jgi:hypothetical protein
MIKKADWNRKRSCKARRIDDEWRKVCVANVESWDRYHGEMGKKREDGSKRVRKKRTWKGKEIQSESINK